MTCFRILHFMTWLRLETSNFGYGLAMWSISLVMTDCPLSGHGQGHVSNFYILDLENFATAGCQCIGVINKLVDGQLVHCTYDGEHVMAECINLLYMSTVTLWLHYFALLWTCRKSCSYTVMQQLARFWLTHCITRSICGSRVSCLSCHECDI